MTFQDPFAHAFQMEPTPREKALYDKFVEEYVKDFSEFEACLRVGFTHSFALEYCRVFMATPYIQRKIAEHKRQPADNSEDALAKNKQLIITTLQQASQNGPYQTRVAAARALAQILGLDQTADKTADAMHDLVEGFKNLAKVVPE